MNLEVEQKFPVRNPEALLARLAELKLTFGPPEIQVDRYFNHPSRDFAKTDEALRIRSVGADNWITYKGPKLDCTTKTRRELELPVGGSAESAGHFAELLQTLGFKSVAEVRKSRSSCELHWEQFLAEIVLDEVENLGHFAEIEIVTDSEKAEAAKSAVMVLAQHLGLEDSERRSYLELLLQRRPTQ